MLNKIIEFSIKNKLIVGLFVVALIAYGALQLVRLPIDAVPDITDNQVQVISATTKSPTMSLFLIENSIILFSINSCY